MSAFKAAFGITSGIGLGVLAAVLAWKLALDLEKRHSDAGQADVRCQQASVALASGDRPKAIRTFLGAKIDEDLLFDLAQDLVESPRAP